MVFLRQDGADLRLEVVVNPKASKSKIAAIHDSRLKIQLAAPPLEGQANKELVNFLAKILSLPKKSVVIIKGLASRRKSLSLEGIKLEKAQQIFSEHLKNLS